MAVQQIFYTKVILNLKKSKLNHLSDTVHGHQKAELRYSLAWD